MKIRPTCLALAAIALLQSQAFAQTYFTAYLTHGAEPEPFGSTPLKTSGGADRPLSFGIATFILNAAMTQMTMSVSVFNIDVTGTQTTDTFDNLLNAHIHVGAPPGSNAPVRWGFFGTPDNDTNPKQMVITPFASGVGGTFTSIWDQSEGNGGTTLTSNLAQIFAGLAYINFHTVQFNGGEIRGQLIVPEGGSTALLLAGAAVGLLALRARTRRSRA